MLKRLYASSGAEWKTGMNERARDMVVGFYDGSSSERNGEKVRITLAGYAAKPHVWRDVEDVWRRVLDGDSGRPKVDCLHMWQANALSDQFALANGWTKSKVDSLLNDLSNRCLSPYGAREPIEDSLVGAVCTVEIEDYRRAQDECPYLQGMPPEEVCVNYVAEVALRLLPEDPNGIMGKAGAVDMYFDRGEKFMRTIYRPWQQHRKNGGLLKLINRIESKRSEDLPGLQAADFLAWHTNRDWWTRDRGDMDLLLRMRMIAAGLLCSDRYDYAKLTDRYKDWPARDPDGRVRRQERR
jgi:hypothetical protein